MMIVARNPQQTWSKGGALSAASVTGIVLASRIVERLLHAAKASVYDGH
jgi:hypothetical protein